MTDDLHVTPEDIGRRVTFQYELPNGFVSEAVGILEAWDAAARTFLVRRKNGELARVPERGVRHGKVIPDAPTPPRAAAPRLDG